MKHLLSTLHAQALSRLASTDVLLAFDFDGTLAPLVARPEAARMRPETRRLLAQLAQLYPCVVLSGRAQQDVLGRLDAVTVWDVVGNHGLEPSSSAEQFAALVRTWVPRLREALAGVPGLFIEDKGLSVALHYRACPDRTEALAAIARAVAALGVLRVVDGKEVVNLLPPGAPDKGVALRRLREKFWCKTALYVGDDETDEDAFALGGPDLLSIRVGARPGSRAEYFLNDQAELDQLLGLLLGYRKPRVGKRRAG